MSALLLNKADIIYHG